MPIFLNIILPLFNTHNINIFTQFINTITNHLKLSFNPNKYILIAIGKPILAISIWTSELTKIYTPYPHKKSGKVKWRRISEEIIWILT